MTTPSVQDLAASVLPEIVALRRELHRTPELGLELPQTQRALLAALDGMGLEITTGRGLSSIVAVLRGEGGPGPAVLLRGDIDALPIEEQSGVDFTSTNAGRMHACGHDLHAAGLVGAAKILARKRSELAGDVIFMFQPGEESPGGALPMIEEGVLEAAGTPVAAAYSVHVHAKGLPFGVFRSKPGTISAHCDEFAVRVRGVGGPASAPAHAKDPLPAACEMVLALQTQITRSFDAFDPVVLTVGRFIGGNRDNVVPEVIEFGGTIRSFSAANRERIAAIVPRVVRGIAAAHDLDVDIDFVPGYPGCVNDPQEFEFARALVGELFGPESFLLSENYTPSGDDFAYIMDRVPSVYFAVGAAVGDAQSAAAGHSPQALFDDAILEQTSAFLAELALRRIPAAG